MELKTKLRIALIIFILLAVSLFFYPKFSKLCMGPFKDIPSNYTGTCGRVCKCFGFQSEEPGYYVPNQIDEIYCYGFTYNCEGLKSIFKE